MTSIAAVLDLDFRPRSYFWPLRLETHLRATVRGAERRATLERYIDGGRLADAPEMVVRDVLTADEQTALGRIHPHFLGGEYLASRRRNEVEIARITIASTTCDVTSVYARFAGGRIRYRVVDEYGGDTLSGRVTRTSVRPLTLRDLGEFFTSAWPLVDVIHMNFGGRDPARALSFARGESAFYPGFGPYVVWSVARWLEETISQSMTA